MNIWEATGSRNVYNCRSTTESTVNSTIIEEVRGSHLKGRNNVNVEVFNETANSLQFIPSNLVDFFPNLKIMYLRAPLLQLIASDLRPFPNLLQFVLQFGQFSTIYSDMFENTKQIKTVQFYSEKLMNVGENILSDLNELKLAQFFSQTCIHFDGNTRERIQELEQKLLVNCLPLLTATSAGTSTIITNCE
jgi:hypothetical protein